MSIPWRSTPLWIWAPAACSTSVRCSSTSPAAPCFPLWRPAAARPTAAAATLQQDTFLTSDSSVAFGQTVDRDALGQWNLTIDAGQGTMTATTIYANQLIDAGGDIAFYGVVGGGPNGPIGVLTLSGHGSGTSSIEIYQNVTTAAGQIYDANVVLGGSVTLTDTGASPIVFTQAVDSDGTVDASGNSPWSLTVQTDGPTESYGPVGGTAPLSGLLVQGYSASNLGTTDINGGSIITSGTGRSRSDRRPNLWQRGNPHRRHGAD